MCHSEYEKLMKSLGIVANMADATIKDIENAAGKSANIIKEPQHPKGKRAVSKSKTSKVSSKTYTLGKYIDKLNKKKKEASKNKALATHSARRAAKRRAEGMATTAGPARSHSKGARVQVARARASAARGTKRKILEARPQTARGVKRAISKSTSKRTTKSEVLRTKCVTSDTTPATRRGAKRKATRTEVRGGKSSVAPVAVRRSKRARRTITK